MVKLKPKNQSDHEVYPKGNRETTDVSYHNFRHQHLRLFILASLFIHSLGLLLFGVYQHRHLANKEKIDSKPIEFVVIPPEESKQKPPPETQKRAVEDSVAEKNTEPKEALTTDELPEKTPPSPTPPKPPVATPKPTPPTPSQAAVPPKTSPKPVSPPKPTPSPVKNQTPVLSGSDTTSVTKPQTKPQAKPTQKDDQVATRLPPNNQPSESIPKSVPSQPSVPSSEGNNTAGDSGAAGLLGGDYQKTLADGGGDAFFSEEALAYKKVLNPDQLNALKDIDLSQYFAQIKRRVKSNWHPSYAVEEYTTFLTFAIQKNGQVTGLKVTQSSGSEQVDRESLTAVQNSAPFDPLPPEFPLEALEVQFSFNIYIY